jgi:lipoprotein-anchoring transpeptidase ErfK/SrfK
MRPEPFRPIACQHIFANACRDGLRGREVVSGTGEPDRRLSRQIIRDISTEDHMRIRSLVPVGSLAVVALFATSGLADAQTLFPWSGAQARTAALHQPAITEPAVVVDAVAMLPARLQRQIVRYDTREAPGTIVIDTPHTYLYYVLGDGRAVRYGIGVGREGFTWSGVKAVTRKAEWPDWYPPAEMIARQPYLPRMTSGGPGNPLGARAMYIGGTMYRIHGTNDPTTIGKQVSSGCIRLTNDDVIDLYNRVGIGAKVVVLPQTQQAQRRASSRTAAAKSEHISSYASPTQHRAEAAWASIRPAGLY